MENFSKIASEIKNTEIKQPNVKAQDIKPKTEMKLKDAKKFLKNVFSGDVIKELNMPEFGGKYIPFEELQKNTPTDGERGKWEGERGNSKFVPSTETEKGQACANKLKEFNKDSIEYKNGEPDFSDVSEATVKIDKMSGFRPSNFAQADINCAKLYNEIAKDGRTDWTAKDVKKWRHDNNCSWHERCDTKTMDLVAEDIHGYCNHEGGVAECNVRDQGKNWGGFDE